MTGDIAFQAQQVAAFTGIHPVILEMGRKLVETPGWVARFKLADSKLKDAAGDMVEMIRFCFFQEGCLRGMFEDTLSLLHAIDFWVEALSLAFNFEGVTK